MDEGEAESGAVITANAAYQISGEAARQLDPEYWERKTLAKDLKNAKVFLQKGILNTESIKHLERRHLKSHTVSIAYG